MERNEQEDDWIGEVQHREGFVLDEGLNALEIPDREVTYRRANVETPFITSRFDSQVDDVYAPPAPDKVLFTTSPATLQDLDDDSSSLLRPGAKAQQQTDTETKSEASSQDLVPTGEVPDARETGYHQVNPMFDSSEPAEVIFKTLQGALKKLEVDFSCSPDWTMDAFALIAAEEVFFNVQLHRLAVKTTIRVDFTLRSGEELKFLALTDSIRKECKGIDKDLMGLPELSFDIMADWSSSGDLFPGSITVDSQELSMLLLEINSEAPPFTRYEVAKRLKELCQYDSNRRALADLLKEQFVTGLQSMLKDDNEDIVRFAIYTILNFADDITTLNDLELPRLPETLRDILTLSHKASTKKLAGDLYKTINAVC
ncbi:hypothetical protein PHYBOEH_008312 [Phytophthora boehmeriae]|uniref:KA1 domain-containing protein n=1 Tax=Phytophthora boehmeriae TaxID=109152 RepID=A0A8T1X747_9STRA|nr:hypothetical protein PHYBOEH_008312 [Phytophthora boehmeriae]